MWKKVLLGLLPVITVICSIQIHYVNSHSINVPIFYYKMNEEVRFDDNYNDTSLESSDGYSITVLGHEQLNIDSFIKKYNIIEEMGLNHYDYISIIHVKIKNCNNTNGSRSGIDMRNLILQNGSYINFFSQVLYSYINTYPETKFSLSENNEMEFWIPFVLTNKDIDPEDFNSGDSFLVISLYPHKCMIKL
ncbi:DUF5028 domain-containing protein [Ruminococcus flavefaciens]|uniref:Uncharacterized protein DUF5028 n=1 Tax=Ruminococcus flavefaciens TaxID=1265 RepID=A0A315XU34_RUMFL|nr:DUF5028 domain-containing protein [Ruminococcus flavefaciens]PWJ10442.1 uncharacterized protein DUF5028 [Ruminococcus flavefaciens]SSA51898.1 protein of unknown function [Ruminococcus flavefaciens]